MKIKTKLIASIMSICLVCAVFAIGVFALKTANLKIGGDVSFSATGVEAHIKNASVSGTVTPTTLAANDAEGEVINTSMTQSDINTTFANWSDIKLDFDENATDIELKFEIANTSTNADNYIEIDYDYSFSTTDPNVDVFPGDENDSDVWENNNYILTPKGSAEGATATYETFTLKFRVLDKELNVKDGTKVNLTISLKHIEPITGTISETDSTKLTGTDGIIYTLNTTNYTASLGSVYSSEADCSFGDNLNLDVENVEIASVVTDGTNNYVVTLIDSVAFSEEDSYKGNANIKTVDIPNSVTIINYGVFYGCTNLSSITIPRSVTNISESLFSSCTNLVSITIPNSVISILGEAFSGCTSLTSITIASSVTTIGNMAFYDCTSLTSITIPSSVTSIGSSVFGGTAWYNNQEAGVVYAGKVAYEYKGTMPENTSITIKEGTVSISREAFSGCTSLTSITIPSSVTSIGYMAFEGCTSLTSITIPNSVTSIGSRAFYNCTNLTSVKFEATTGWWYASSSTATSGTELTISETDFAANATLLKTTYYDKYWFRTAA